MTAICRASIALEQHRIRVTSQEPMQDFSLKRCRASVAVLQQHLPCRFVGIIGFQNESACTASCKEGHCLLITLCASTILQALQCLPCQHQLIPLHWRPPQSVSVQSCVGRPNIVQQHILLQVARPYGIHQCECRSQHPASDDLHSTAVSACRHSHPASKSFIAQRDGNAAGR